MSRFYGIVSRELDVEKSFVQPLSLIRKFPSSGAQLTENGRWDLVGGHVDRGEEVEDALIRECQDEVGLTSTSFTLLAILRARRQIKDHTILHLCRLGVVRR